LPVSWSKSSFGFLSKSVLPDCRDEPFQSIPKVLLQCLLPRSKGAGLSMGL
jgi:hypothetical protein